MTFLFVPLEYGASFAHSPVTRGDIVAGVRGHVQRLVSSRGQLSSRYTRLATRHSDLGTRGHALRRQVHRLSKRLSHVRLARKLTNKDHGQSGTQTHIGHLVQRISGYVTLLKEPR